MERPDDRAPKIRWAAYWAQEQGVSMEEAVAACQPMVKREIMDRLDGVYTEPSGDIPTPPAPKPAAKAEAKAEPVKKATKKAGGGRGKSSPGTTPAD